MRITSAVLSALASATVAASTRRSRLGRRSAAHASAEAMPHASSMLMDQSNSLRLGALKMPVIKTINGILSHRKPVTSRAGQGERTSMTISAKRAVATMNTVRLASTSTCQMCSGSGALSSKRSTTLTDHATSASA